MPTEKGVVLNLRVWRLHAALSQDDLAERSGVSRATIWRGEKGGTINYGNARKLANTLGVTLEQLRFEQPPEQRER